MTKKKMSAKPVFALSSLALLLLRSMAEQPARIEYNTRVLGGGFREADVDRLDQAYAELAQAGLIAKAGPFLSFFGVPKALFRITPAGERLAKEAA